MLNALWNAASMLTGGGSRESWEESSPKSSPEHTRKDSARDGWNSQQTTPTPSPVHSRSESTPSAMSNAGRPSWPESYGDAGFSEDLPYGNVPPQWLGSGSNRLFIQLLDDLDDLSTNSQSAHRRRRAREIFSEWLFSADVRSPVHAPAALSRNDPFRRSSAAEYGPRRRSDIVRADDKVLRRCSGDFSAVDVTQECREFSPVRLRENVQPADCDRANRRRSVPPTMFLVDESENDSGYHTGPGYRTVLPRRPPGERTLTRDDLRRRISNFNANNHGLLMDVPTDDSDMFQGFIRVHMNLIRPINMCISVEPPTLFDVCSSDTSNQSRNKDTQLTSFYLPKDTTKVIHISSRTTTDEVIKILLSKFYITDNPRKFALYEKIEESGKTVSRRVADDEQPLPICLSWTSSGLERLDRNKFVLQDNDTGEILWEAFSLPELENFLVVLNREEEEYVNQLKAKYRLLKIQMKKRLQSLEQRNEKTTSGGDKRTPVFV